MDECVRVFALEGHSIVRCIYSTELSSMADLAQNLVRLLIVEGFFSSVNVEAIEFSYSSVNFPFEKCIKFLMLFDSCIAPEGINSIQGMLRQ